MNTEWNNVWSQQVVPWSYALPPSQTAPAFRYFLRCDSCKKRHHVEESLIREVLAERALDKASPNRRTYRKFFVHCDGCQNDIRLYGNEAYYPEL